MPTLNDYANECHKANEQWWVDIHTGEPLDRNIGEMLMLDVTEVSESMEGARKELMDDHLPHRKMAEVEMADAFIRHMDLCGGLGISMPGGVIIDGCDGLAEMVNACRIEPPIGNVGDSLIDIVEAIVDFRRARPSRDTACESYVILRACGVAIEIFRHCNEFGYDLQGAYEEKMAYNATRVDHKHENRRKPGGKKC